MKQRLSQFYAHVVRIAASKSVTVGILVFFVLQALLLAVVMHPGVPPDEKNHIEFMNYYGDHSLSPFLTKQEPTWSLGDKTREVDYLYHYAMSLVTRVVPGEAPDLYVIRALSIVCAALSFIVLIQIFQRIGIPRGAINTSLAVVTNLPMVLMLSAAVNNDVMVWLLTMIAVLLLLRLWRQPMLIDVLLLVNVFAFGGLVKRTLLPLAVLFAVASIIIVIKKWQTFKKSFVFTPRLVIASVLLVLGVGLVAERIGGNLYHYQAISPSCERVQGKEACADFWLNARTRWIEKGSPADENIWLPVGTTVDTEVRALPIFAAQWSMASLTNVIDIQTQGWLHEVKPWKILAPLAVILLTVTIILMFMYDARRYKNQVNARRRLFVGFIGLFVIVTFLVVNYMSYQSHHIFGLALNGRYILPGLMLLSGLGCFYWSKMLGKNIAQIAAIIISALFIFGSGIIMMLRNPQLFG